jgi:hypothetical protein
MVQRAASSRARLRAGGRQGVKGRTSGYAALDPPASHCRGAVFFASIAMKATTLRRKARLALAHTIAVIWLAAELAHEAGFALGSAVHRLNAWMAARAARPAPDPKLEAVISGWEEACAAGLWQEPEPVEPLCPGAWWDLVDPGDAAAADLELPLRWAV